MIDLLPSNIKEGGLIDLHILLFNNVNSIIKDYFKFNNSNIFTWQNMRSKLMNVTQSSELEEETACKNFDTLFKYCGSLA